MKNKYLSIAYDLLHPIVDEEGTVVHLPHPTWMQNVAEYIQEVEEELIEVEKNEQ